MHFASKIRAKKGERWRKIGVARGKEREKGHLVAILPGPLSCIVLEGGFAVPRQLQLGPRCFWNIEGILWLISELMSGEKKTKLHLKGIYLFIF